MRNILLLAVLAALPTLRAAEPFIWSYWCHEPADHLRRMGTNPSVFTLGEWMPKWYERMHGEELISRAAGYGVNHVYMHFFKGFGLKHEQGEMERTREFAKIAHAKGVKILAYCTFGSVYYETFKDEFPGLEDWMARDQNGRIMEYGGVAGQYYRWRPCVESREYVDYLKKVISYGIEHVGIDGFHFDNSQIDPCYCERCQAAFRDWLAENVKDPRAICGLGHFRNVRIPPTPQNIEVGGETHDPLAIWALRFRKARQERFFAELFAHVKSYGADKLIMHNSGYMRYTWNTTASYSKTALAADIQIIENPFQIRVQNDRVWTQILGYKMSRRFGFRVMDGTWYRNPDGTQTIPRDADRFERFFAQGMIYGNVCGAAWMPRSVKIGDRTIMDLPAVDGAMRRAFGHFRAHADLYDGGPVARTHLLYSEDNCYGMSRGWANAGFTNLLHLAERLNTARIPYTVAVEDDIGNIPAGDALVLPDLRYARVAQHDRLVAAAARGVRLVLTGPYGLYDENGVERDLANPIVGLSRAKGLSHDLPADEAVTIRDESAKEVPYAVIETSVNGAGDFVFHVLRPDNETVLGRVTIEIPNGRIHSGSEPELHSFDAGCRLVSSEVGEGRAILAVDGLKTFASIRFRQLRQDSVPVEGPLMEQQR